MAQVRTEGKFKVVGEYTSGPSIGRTWLVKAVKTHKEAASLRQRLKRSVFTGERYYVVAPDGKKIE